MDDAGHIIMDYSIHDAIEAGFNHVVFIIRKDIEKEFKEVIGDRIASICSSHNVTVDCAFQDINDIPGTLPEGRTKPWGTGQAVLAAKSVIKTPFIVINADDYYGKEGFKAVHEYLVNGGKSCMAGFVLKNTLSDNGGVTRGICKMDEDNNLTEVVETKNIVKTATGAEADGVAVDYHGAENRKKVAHSNLYIGTLVYNNQTYYLCAKQGNSSDRLLQGKCVFMTHQDELVKANPDEVFLMSSYVGFVVDPVEEKVLIFDKKAFQAVFKYDDYQKEDVQRKISIVDQWSFLESANVIKERCAQKNVYRNLARIFADQEYMEQIQRTTPAQLKNNLLTNSPQNFKEDDFQGEQLIVTTRNLNTVMKMLAKGFKFNFFTNNAEQQ